MTEPLQDAREGLRRIQDIVRDVKLFSRPHDDVSSLIDVRRVIDSSSRMAWNEIRHRARLVKDYREVAPVQANESRLGQVILNLIINAAHAIPEGRADANEIRLGARMSSDHRVVVDVADTGAGIPAENLERIFDPFFTTKPVGVGTGLGLAICHRIVANLGGHIEVKTELGKGTVFSVVLPAAERSAPRADPPVTPELAHTKGRVLVVDDEVGLGRALQRALRDHHEVVAVTSARDALAKLHAGERFDAIVSDVMMPDVSGMEMHRRLESSFPEQAKRVVFLTGGAFTQAAREFLDSVPNPCLEKPFEPKALLAVIAGLTRS
jgi:CheY-like chemotaxis protein/two-component sensor histidine kinase